MGNPNDIGESSEYLMNAIFTGDRTGRLLPDLIVFGYSNVWEIADRPFKIITWFILLATLRAMSEISGSNLLHVLYIYATACFEFAVIRCLVRPAGRRRASSGIIQQYRAGGEGLLSAYLFLPAQRYSWERFTF